MPSAMKMVHENDPAKEIWDRVKHLKGVRSLTGNQVLLGVYLRPEKTASGIFLSDVTRKEDEHQGKVGLVLKLGSQAFVDSDDYKFNEEEKAKVGDWVQMWVTDGRKTQLHNQLCRVVRDFEIRMILDEPDVVY
ncbi:MAG TPA: hypothetical protein VFA65_24175 [Bryobacteraceae bacterium]|nr:hypothetical protein [Bryobacteraceae bacterium]